jgi:paraquat-inducible protein A
LTIACPDCGTLQDLPPLLTHAKAVCCLCDADLEKTNGRSLGATLACSLATFLLLIPSNVFPLIRVELFGMVAQSVILAGVGRLWSSQWVLLAAISAVLVIAIPFIRFGLLSAVLATVLFGRRPRWLGPAFRWTIWLDPWAMVDVFLLASFVGYYRLVHLSMAHVTIQPGGGCFLAAGFLSMLSRACLDRRTIWRTITPEIEPATRVATLSCTTCDLVQPIDCGGEKCPRCGARLHARKPYAMMRTTALLIAAALLVLPANIYPMDISSHLGETQNYTIFTGVRELFESGLWPLGVIIFCTSILIPVGKIIVIGWCVFSVWHRSTRHLIVKTKLFRAVSELGRWSKTDPFTIVFFVPLVNFGGLASATAGAGAMCFMMMSILTMIASITFDPRLMWDLAEGVQDRVRMPLRAHPKRPAIQLRPG